VVVVVDVVEGADVAGDGVGSTSTSDAGAGGSAASETVVVVREVVAGLGVVP